jgi:hypothetical protein
MAYTTHKSFVALTVTTALCAPISGLAQNRERLELME